MTRRMARDSSKCPHPDFEGEGAVKETAAGVTVDLYAEVGWLDQRVRWRVMVKVDPASGKEG